jgi:hypothetical protein
LRSVGPHCYKEQKGGGTVTAVSAAGTVIAVSAAGEHVVSEISEWWVTENWECRLVTTLEKKEGGNVSIARDEETTTRFERNCWKY